MSKSNENMERYVSYSAFNEFMQIMYEQLGTKVGSDVVNTIKEKVELLDTSSVTTADIVSAFENFDSEAEDAGSKVAAVELVKTVKDAVDELQTKFESGVNADTLGELGKDDFVQVTDVITSLDDYDEDTLQVVAATLIKAISDKVDGLETKVDGIETKVDDLIDTKGQANGLAPLDDTGKIPSEHLPAYVDDVVDVYVVEEKDEDGYVTSVKLYTDADHTNEVKYEKGVIYIDVTNPEVAGDSYRYSGTTLVNLGHPKFREITAEEVQEMWDSIEIPEDTENE